MRMTWKVARLFDTDVHVHVSFPLMVIWFVVLAKGIGHTPATLGMALLLFAFACVCILAHEFGHVLVARRYGIQTKEITMLPVGAVSRLEKNPENPVEDLIVSAAGPVVSIALALVFYLFAKMAGDPRVGDLTQVAAASIWAKLCWTNVIIAMVNLIPALPMDGGKLVKAGLSLIVDQASATRIAAWLSYVAAILLFVYGLRADPFFVILAGVVAYCARQETQRLRAEALAKDPLVKTAVVTDFDFLTPDVALMDVLDDVLTNPQRDLPVLDGERLCGIVTREALKRGLAGGKRRVLVREIMAEEFAVVHVEEKLEEALAWMLAEDLWVMPVTDGEQLVGMLRLTDAEDVQLHYAAQAEALEAG